MSNTQLFMFMYPRVRQEAEAAFLIGTYMELVDSEAVTKQKELWHFEGSPQSQGGLFEKQGCSRDLPPTGLAVKTRRM